MKRPSGSRTVHLPPDVVALCDHARLGTPLASFVTQVLRSHCVAQALRESVATASLIEPKPSPGPLPDAAPCRRCPNLHDLIHTMGRCRCTCHQP